MIKYLFLFVILSAYTINLFAQKIITMTSNGSYFSLPAKINGTPVNMIFSPSMEKVIIPVETGRYYYQNGIITEKDVTNASEDWAEINIKEIEIGGIVINNVSAVILSNYTGPVVLGQSAMKKLGRYSVNGNQLTLLDYTADRSYAIRYGESWLDRKEFSRRIQIKSGEYADYMGLIGDERTDFYLWLNLIMNELYNGNVWFNNNLGISNINNINQQCCWYYNKNGTRNKGKFYLDVRQSVINFICGIADAMAKSGRKDINGVIK